MDIPAKLNHVDEPTDATTVPVVFIVQYPNAPLDTTAKYSA